MIGLQHMLNWDWAYNSYHWSSISLSQHNKTEQRKHTIIEVSKGDCIRMGILTMVILNGIQYRAQG